MQTFVKCPVYSTNCFSLLFLSMIDWSGIPPVKQEKRSDEEVMKGLESVYFILFVSITAMILLVRAPLFIPTSHLKYIALIVLLNGVNCK